MSDEERFLEEDEQEGLDDVEVGKKVGVLPAIVIKILQIAAIALALIILVITVSVVTYNVLSKGKTGQSPQIVAPEYSDKKEIYEYFGAINQVRGPTRDNPPQTFTAALSIGYEMGNKMVQSELTSRIVQLKNLILIFLSNKTAEELSSDRIELLQTDLKRRINDIMKEKIEVVLFTELQAF